MADNRNYFEFIDIPDGSGGTDRRYIKDAEAQAAIGYSAEFADLGLPSGTLWAKCNIGADSETGYGNYYMYGKGDRQYNGSDSAYTGTENPLDPTKDTATVVLGAPWHMPTQAQLQELLANTIYTWVTNFDGSGINGAKFTAQNGNYVFFPAAGYWFNGIQNDVGGGSCIWSSTPYDSSGAYRFGFDSGGKGVGSGSRDYGYSIRPVCESTPVNRVSDKANKRDVYTKGQVDDMLNSVVAGSTAAELFTFEVDVPTMNLHVYSTAAYANAFEVEDGMLKIDLSAMPPSE